MGILTLFHEITDEQLQQEARPQDLQPFAATHVEPAGGAMLPVRARTG